MSMNDDIKQYDCYLFYKGTLQKVDWITSTESYNHFVY